ncbi:hypothetical protein [Flammeovirga pacifica]|uniref:Uncharacterized protein n=1 Tax=Flammeovirga pacifica TaxID=915059 RepID=A0A1S1Z2B7_FLAPC|nr:hypothetical protein [Flammeovirga pacifica]OHX67367.1 hypothetical protein NH26_13950 [Flammeovirga pacifica]
MTHEELEQVTKGIGEVVIDKSKKQPYERVLNLFFQLLIYGITFSFIAYLITSKDKATTSFISTTVEFKNVAETGNVLMKEIIDYTKNTTLSDSLRHNTMMHELADLKAEIKKAQEEIKKNRKVIEKQNLRWRNINTGSSQKSE